MGIFRNLFRYFYALSDNCSHCRQTKTNPNQNIFSKHNPSEKKTDSKAKRQFKVVLWYINLLYHGKPLGFWKTGAILHNWCCYSIIVLITPLYVTVVVKLDKLIQWQLRVSEQHARPKEHVLHIMNNICHHHTVLLKYPWGKGLTVATLDKYI